MAQDMEGAVERSEGTPVRESVLASVAAHSTSPDIENIVSGAREDHAREIRNRDRERPRDSKQYEGEQSDKRRGAIRAAINEEKLKVAAGPTKPATTREAPTPAAGPPAFLSLDSRAVFNELPEKVQLDLRRVDAQLRTAYEPHLQRLSEFDRELSPIRHLYQRHGLSDAQGMAKIARTISALHDPRTAVQAYHELGRELNIAPLGYQPQQPSYNPQQYVEQQVSQFQHQHPGITEEIWGKMAKLITAHGNPDLEWAYQQARQAIPSQPATRSKQGSVRSSITNSIDDLRQRRA